VLLSFSGADQSIRSAVNTSPATDNATAITVFAASERLSVAPNDNNVAT